MVVPLASTTYLSGCGLIKVRTRLSGRQSSARIAMETFSFGARERSIIQAAYTVADIQKEMRRYSNLLRISPSFLVCPFLPSKVVYRGAKTNMHLSLSVSFAREIMI